jgi:hypothetical protein
MSDPDVGGITAAVREFVQKRSDSDSARGGGRRMTEPNLVVTSELNGVFLRKESKSTRGRASTLESHHAAGLGPRLLEELEHVTDRWSSSKPSSDLAYRGKSSSGSSGSGGKGTGGGSTRPDSMGDEEMPYGGYTSDTDKDGMSSATVSPTQSMSKRTSFSVSVPSIYLQRKSCPGNL